MKGYVPTPAAVVDVMVHMLFQDRVPSEDSWLLDPGCGEGAFLAGVIRWCGERDLSLPHMVGVESDPCHASIAQERFRAVPQVEIRQSDFLAQTRGPSTYDFVVGNPPYVSILGLTENERRRYRGEFVTARGRFDLYLLFFEQALRCLRTDGRLVFITPEKFLYVETAAPLRRLLASLQVEAVRLLPEETFPGLTTYPAITSVLSRLPQTAAKLVRRDGTVMTARLDGDGASWWPRLQGIGRGDPGQRQVALEDLCIRVSCGVATGADEIFVRPAAGLDSKLRAFSYPTISGRELRDSAAVELPVPSFQMLVPYGPEGHLLGRDEMAGLWGYLDQPFVRNRLRDRTCAKRKPWYAFHETPPLNDILRPKLICKDITAKPRFWVDREGGVVPRHSVYYIVPRQPGQLDALQDYLNSATADRWLRAHCQRAANGYLRLQSSVLRKLPVPVGVADSDITRIVARKAGDATSQSGSLEKQSAVG